MSTNVPAVPCTGVAPTPAERRQSTAVARSAERRSFAALALVVACVTALGVPAHSTYGARAAVDEPQYLLTAISLGRDGDLDISDELAAEAYRPFHRVDLPRQTSPLDESGREVSPHDPLLPVLLAAPVRLGGWVGARMALAATAGALAAATAWTAARRFGVAHRTAVLVVGAFACTAPLATYATQVYPEVPAALGAVLAVAAATAPPSRRAAAVLVPAVVALPWLSVKYAPLASAAAFGALVAWRRKRRLVVAIATVLAAAGAAYLLAHRAVYGGWTSYAASGLGAESGELAVVGRPDHLGRTRRFVGLLVDDPFGIALWMPAWLLLPVAVAALTRRRPPGWALLLAPLAAGWLVASLVALTMHGWWWPGRQLVAVLPLAVVAIAWCADRIDAVRRVLVVVAALGVVTWVWTTVEAITRRRVLVVDFDRTANPWVRLWRLALPNGRAPSATDGILLAAWTVAVAGLAWAGWHAGGSGAHPSRTPLVSPPPRDR